MVSRPLHFEVKRDARKENFPPIFKVRAIEALSHASRSGCFSGAIGMIGKYPKRCWKLGQVAYFRFVTYQTVSLCRSATQHHHHLAFLIFIQKFVLFLFHCVHFIFSYDFLSKKPSFLGYRTIFFKFFWDHFYLWVRQIVSAIWKEGRSIEDRG